ncbi:MaoC/PaaZ C-terminal domain-containing protein [Mucilaginibacter sp. dw_454]|uniref:MaoC/PaaZ C-terminal domain-containing protein n=1 Tax=Mucilaginibacter sp. dw_454 TaxID=2720079 RepID=UPI001BD5C906|nr:MaoC/PaaZ C-terminal domain-containing protein [Mucilaginibacter sp. dw_454]
MIFKNGDSFDRKFLVTETVYNGFIATFKDTNPLHTDEAFAIAHGFEGRVMHGNILNGFLSYFIGECLPDKNVIILSQEIQFKKPVYLHDELLFNAQITNVSEAVKAVEFKFTFKNPAGKVVSKGQIQIGLLA